MKIINQLGIILGFWLLGELLSNLMSHFVLIPGAIVGMLLFTLALVVGLLKEAHVKEMSDLLIGNISFFFVPASVGVLAITGLTNRVLFIIILITLISTFTTMLVTMWVTNQLIKKRGDR